jgi:NodT family efflux transporter outer membrane factor (OMF) lipoprotein
MKIPKALHWFLPAILLVACRIPNETVKTADKRIPSAYGISSGDTLNDASVSWKSFFGDTLLNRLIDTALKRNRELNIVMEEIRMSKNEISAKRGEYLPFVNLGAGGGTEKVGRYTSQGANDANTEIAPGKKFPDPLGDMKLGAFATWELDVWKKLRNARESAVKKYLGSIEGKNFLVTQLVGEISASYYELLALDNQLEILKNTISIQQNALEIVKAEKAAARVTELAVKKFEAEVLKNTALQFDVQQQITETENRINLLLGRYPQAIPRNASLFNAQAPRAVKSGLPSQLLANRADIRQAEQLLAASGLDVKSARAEFYPSFRMVAGLGYQAFSAKYLLSTPESMLFNLAGDMVAPLINRRAIRAAYGNAAARQVQAAYRYEQTLLQAYTEVSNGLSRVSNLEKSMENKKLQVEALNRSIEVAGTLFSSARADYMEVLMTQRDALEARFELTENRMKQMQAMVQLYKALGGGWR